MKQYNSAKPHKYGFKMFKLCDSSSFMTWFMLYEGKTNHPIDHAGLPTTVVRAATHSLLHDQFYRLYMDSWYTSVPVCEELLGNGIYVVGTVSKRRLGLPHTVVQAVLKNRGQVSAAMKQLREGALTALQWLDTRHVFALSTAHAMEIGPVVRPKRGHAEGVEIDCPLALVD